MNRLEQILSSKPHNEHHLKRYLKFIEECQYRPKSGKLEEHHICPKAEDMFPEYKSLAVYRWNSVYLTPREHFIAHHILWKVYKTRSTQFAFFKMSHSKSTDIKLTGRSSELLKIAVAERSIENYKVREVNVRKASQRNIGSKWYNNGIEQRRFHEPKDGWVLGKLKRTSESYAAQGRAGLKYFNNGIENRKFSEAPDSSWSPGMKPRIPRT